MTGPTARPLPEYTIRVSPKARMVRLTVSARDGLVVVVPRGVRVDTDNVVRSKQEWAERALDRVRARREELARGADALLPDEVDLRGIGLSAPVEYRTTGSSGVRSRSHGGLVVLEGDMSDAEACLAALRRWLARTAAEALPERVRAVAAAENMHPRAVRVGGARTRWGSCSARGTISLSRNSVFLRPYLLDALIRHELAHLDVMDHSPRFWARLTEMDAEAIRHRRELKDAEALVPAWAVT